MRNPAASVLKMPHVRNPAWQVRELLYKAQSLWPQLANPAEAILEGRPATEIPAEIVERVRGSLIRMLGGYNGPRARTARAQTPIQANVIEAWGQATHDPDTQHLSQWLDHGAPLGFTQEIPSVGVFPVVETHDAAEVDSDNMFRFWDWVGGR